MSPLATTDLTGARAIRNSEPWLVHTAVNWLGTFLLALEKGPNSRVLEWGCGGSTVWYARRVSHVTSVEHHYKWHRATIEKANQLGVFNIDHVYVPCKGAKGCFRAYAEFVKGFDEATFDIVNVDGRARVRCIEQVLMHKLVKPGGLLVLDNSERNYYSPALQMLTNAGWSVNHFDDQWRTTIVQKPGGGPPQALARMAAEQASREVAG